MITPLPTAAPVGSLDKVRAQHPLRFAWAVIWLSFAVLVVMLTFAVRAGIIYISTAMSPQTATLVAANGIVLVQEPTWDRPGTVHPDQVLNQGDLIQTDATASAQINFFDGSTVYLQPGAQVRITEMQSNRYSVLSQQSRYVTLSLEQGKLEAKVAPYTGSDSHFVVTTFGATVTIPSGTSDVWLSQPHANTNSCCATQVLTQIGKSTVTGSGDQAVVLNGDQRTTVPMGGVPLGALAPTWDLLANGTFQSQSLGLPDVWDLRLDPDTLDAANYVSFVPGPTPMLRLRSTGADQGHHGVYFQQDLSRDVRDFLRIDLVVKFRILNQDLPGGGIQGSEYPFRVTVDYIGRSGGETQWFHGFYILPASGKYVVDDNSQQVDQGQWFPASSSVGEMRLSDLPDPPVFIKWVEFSASGWDFDTEIQEVRLLAQ